VEFRFLVIGDCICFAFVFAEEVWDFEGAVGVAVVQDMFEQVRQALEMLGGLLVAPRLDVQSRAGNGVVARY
jgi:hypothetical protein